MSEIQRFTAKDGSIVIMKEQKEGRDCACEGCIFDDYEQCWKPSGEELQDICCTEDVIFISAPPIDGV